MKMFNEQRLKLTGLAGTGLLLLALTRPLAWGQSAPGLTIAAAGTNEYSITVTNAIPGFNYELWWTPVLGNTTDFPWTMTPPGSPGQTNFVLVNSGYPAVFFRGVLDTNAIPLWQQSNPNNSPSPILKVTILNPANGATLN